MELIMMVTFSTTLNPMVKNALAINNFEKSIMDKITIRGLVNRCTKNL